MAGKRLAEAPAPCPCGGGRPYSICCQPFHDGAKPTTAEALMRSRYVAYILGLEDYLLATWHPETRPQALDSAREPPPKWLGLEVRRHIQVTAESATVEFIARYRVGGHAERLHETSRFLRMQEVWYYVDGEIHPR